MKKPKEVWIVFICVILFMFTASFLSVYGESIIDIIAAKQQSDMKKERLRTYGLSKTEWRYLNEKGITLQNAQNMEKLLYDHSEVASLLKDTVQKIRYGTYTEEDNPVKRFREELKLNIYPSADEVATNKLENIYGLWEANSRFMMENEKYGSHFFVKLTKDGSRLIVMTMYNKEMEMPVQAFLLFLEDTWDDTFSMRMEEDAREAVVITKENDDTLSMQIDSIFYDLTRVEESELDEYMQ